MRMATMIDGDVMTDQLCHEWAVSVGGTGRHVYSHLPSSHSHSLSISYSRVLRRVAPRAAEHGPRDVGRSP